MRPSAPLPLLLSVSTAANAIPLLDRLLHLRDAKPTKTYSVVNVEGSPSTDSPAVITVTKSAIPATVTERVTDTVIEISSAVQTTQTSSKSLVIVNVDGTANPAPTTITIYKSVTPTPESTPSPPTTTPTPPAAPPSSSILPDAYITNPPAYCALIYYGVRSVEFRDPQPSTVISPGILNPSRGSASSANRNPGGLKRVTGTARQPFHGRGRTFAVDSNTSRVYFQQRAATNRAFAIIHPTNRAVAIIHSTTGRCILVIFSICLSPQHEHCGDLRAHPNTKPGLRDHLPNHLGAAD
ncbi:hypothetical protein EsH8_I_001386 [Colletotrichum jinshuiense]